MMKVLTFDTDAAVEVVHVYRRYHTSSEIRDGRGKFQQTNGDMDLMSDREENRKERIVYTIMNKLSIM